MAINISTIVTRHAVDILCSLLRLSLSLGDKGCHTYSTVTIAAAATIYTVTTVTATAAVAAVLPRSV